MQYQEKKHVLLAKLKEYCQQNFDGELESKQVKIIGCHVPRAPVPERLASFSQSTFITEKLLKRKGASGEHTSLSIKIINGEASYKSCAVKGFEVSNSK